MIIKQYLKNFLKYIVRGGVTNVNITQLNWNENLFAGKSVLITGGSGGIGSEIASKFLKLGTNVIITGTNQNKLEETQKKLQNLGSIQIINWDISDTKSIEAKFNEVIQMSKGDLCILINNAGVYLEKKILSVTEEEWDYINNINLKGTYFLSKEFLKYRMRLNSKGKIINISSNRANCGDTSPYGIGKRGVVALTEGLGRDFIKAGIIVNGIAPGMTASNINGINAHENAYANSERNGRVVLPEEIAELAAWLASDACMSIVGQTIVIDGGTSLN